jgi:hypothetical protein
MRGSGYFVAVFLFFLGAYTLRTCLRDFHRARGTGTLKRFPYALGILLSIGLIILAFLGALLITVGPLH